MRRILLSVLGVFAGLLACILVALQIPTIVRNIEFGILNPGLRSDTTPAALGLTFERLSIPSNERRLDAFLVRAAASCEKPPALLIFHGVDETAPNWFAAQQLLAAHCITSLMFDYSGHGASSPHGSIGHMKKDAQAAYAGFVARIPDGRRCVMSFSMGAGPMLEAITRFKPAPDCVVVASAFTSARDWSVAFAHVPRALTYLMTDIWDNERNIAAVRSPILIVHSASDEINPFEMGKRLFAAAPRPKSFAPLENLSHNSSYRKPTEKWWAPAMAFVTGSNR
jgi:alpha-beta hydrolase superfamily lysophospholipase